MKRSIKIIIYFIPALICIWIIEKNIVFSGHAVFTNNYYKPPILVSNLYPLSRVTAVTSHEQVTNFLPVFFDVQVPPRSFNKVKIEVKYKGQLDKVGVQITSQQKDIYYKNLTSDGESQGLKTAHQEFEFGRLHRDENNKSTFAFTAKDSRNRVTVKQIKVYFDGDFKTPWKKLKSKIF